MITQEGGNVAVYAVKGNFDDAQSGVKKIFTDEEYKKELSSKNISLSSANSINFGRLVPQVVYYFMLIQDLLKPVISRQEIGLTLLFPRETSVIFLRHIMQK